MAHECPWCGKMLPLSQAMLGKSGACPGCRGKIRIPSTPAGKIEKVAPPPGAAASAFEDETPASRDPLELAEGPPAPPKRAAAEPPAAAAGPMPGDSNWRPYLSSEERTRPTKAVAGAGGVALLIMFIVFCRISCMGAQRASQSKIDNRASPGVVSGRGR